MRSILFVCQGNLCRSPAGEAILLHLAHSQGIDLLVASCGVSVGEEGAPADSRMQDAARKRGLALDSKTQAFQVKFFNTYDLILASDRLTSQILRMHAPNNKTAAKILLMTEYSAKYHGLEIPDPYRGGSDYFDCVLDMISDACEGLLQELEKRKQ